MKRRFFWLVTNVHGDSWVQENRPKKMREGTKCQRILVYSEVMPPYFSVPF